MRTRAGYAPQVFTTSPSSMESERWVVAVLNADSGGFPQGADLFADVVEAEVVDDELDDSDAQNS